MIMLILYIMSLMYQNFTPLDSNSLHLSCTAVMQTNSSDNHAQYTSYKENPVNILILGQGNKIPSMRKERRENFSNH